MTEAEWQSCPYAISMLEHLPQPASVRKLRLLVCACCRHPAIWRLLQIHRGVDLVVVTERYLDSLATRAELEAAAQRAPQGRVTGGAGLSMRPVRLSLSSQAQRVALHLANENAYEASYGAIQDGTDLMGSSAADLIRDIFGNPFYPPAFDPTWRTPEVIALAYSIYDDPSTALWPSLATALENAGCQDVRMLTHCRGGQHVRGCWVIDLLLDKEQA